MALQPVRGTHDLLGDDSRRYRYIVETALGLARNYGFEEIATPIFESVDVFKRTLGDASDIVNKEMYTFEDRGGDLLTLRPEGTAGVARAVISNGLFHQLPLKFFYQGPMFRYERPQKGRTRQFHQLGVELLGVAGPQADIECLSLASNMLAGLGLAELTRLELNTIGDIDSRKQYRSALVEYFSKYEKELSTDSQRRLQLNPMRILDSKDAKDQSIAENAPKFGDYLNDLSKAFYAQVLEGLERLGISYTENPRLVRGLDYYSHCVFEFKTSALGAQDAVLAGGRYDGLMEIMGGPATPGAGWAAGIERLSLLLKQLPAPSRPVALIPLGEEAEKEALRLAHQLRSQGMYVDMAYSGNMGKRMKKANKAQAKVAVIMGSEELQKGVVSLKDFDNGEQREVRLQDLEQELRNSLGL